MSQRSGWSNPELSRSDWDGSRSAPPSSSPRASDQDRNRAVDALRQATTDGYLSLVEFEERVGGAFSARYVSQLDALLSDIPGARQFLRPPTPRARPVRRAPVSSHGVLRMCLIVLLALAVISVVAEIGLPLLVFGGLFLCWRRGCSARYVRSRAGGRPPEFI